MKKNTMFFKNSIIMGLTISLIMMICMTHKSFGQVILIGKWKATCAKELTDKKAIMFCELCPSKISQDKKTLSYYNFEMDVEKTDMKLIIDSVTTQVDYKLDSNLYTLEFKYKDKLYNFKILYLDNTNHYILKDNDGMLILLEKN